MALAFAVLKKKIAPLSFLTDANEAMFTFLIRCLNKDKTRSLGEGKQRGEKKNTPRRRNPNTIH